MSDPVLFLSRPASEGLALIHTAAERKLVEPMWRLLLTAVFAAGAALTFATVVIFGAPGGVSVGDPWAAKSVPVHMTIATAR